MIESSDDEFEYFVESVLVSFDDLSVKDAIYVRRYDPLYHCENVQRYFTAKKSFFMYIDKVFSLNDDIMTTIAVKCDNGELMNLNSALIIQNDFIKHGYFIGEKDSGGFFKLRKLHVGETVLNNV